jgi:hypothetical protein
VRASSGDPLAPGRVGSCASEARGGIEGGKQVSPTSPKSRSVLTGLAVLKVNWDRLGKDYVENFVPIVVECLRGAADDEVALPELQNSIREQFGLLLPLNSLRVIIKRAAKRGFLRRDSGVFYRVRDKCDDPAFRDAQRKVESIHARVVGELREFANSEHGRDWNDDEAEIALHAFIRESSLSLLFDIAESREAPPPATQESQYVVAKFISDARQREPKLVDDIVVLLQGNLLANAMYLPDPGGVGQRFNRTSVYLDTTFLVFAAGFAGATRAAPCLELVELLHEYGADLRCLQITVDEVRGILDACAFRLRSNRLRDAHGPTIEYFVESGKSASDVELMSARLPQRLNELGIQVDQKPRYEREFQIDEAALERTLEDELHYRNPKAKIHDVDCLSAIARIRRGRESFAIETSHAVFVTTNLVLARAARKFFQADSSPGAAALCVTDYALGNLLWLKSPTKVPDLPAKRLLADAYAAMQPPEALWKRYLIEIARLEDEGKVSAEEYYVLRHSLAAKATLMDVTDGDLDAFTEGTVKEVLQVAKEAIRADLSDALKLEQERRLEAERAAEQMKRTEIERKAAARQRAERTARILSRAVFVIVLALILLGTGYSFPWDLPKPSGGWLHYLISGSLFFLFVLSIGNLVWGTTVRDVLQRIESRLADVIRARVLDP